MLLQTCLGGHLPIVHHDHQTWHHASLREVLPQVFVRPAMMRASVLFFFFKEANVIYYINLMWNSLRKSCYYDRRSFVNHVHSSMYSSRRLHVECD